MMLKQTFLFSVEFINQMVIHSCNLGNLIYLVMEHVFIVIANRDVTAQRVLCLKNRKRLDYKAKTIRILIKWSLLMHFVFHCIYKNTLLLNINTHFRTFCHATIVRYGYFNTLLVGIFNLKVCVMSS